LNGQIRDMKQALARMDRFQAITGIPYDKVMIFPHSIAPEQTLAALKTYNYWATVNSSNVPEGDPTSENFSQALRPVALSYGGFPSILRYSAAVEIPRQYIAINEFLGNPLFFYAHSDLFSDGIGAFDHVADEVNQIEPATAWRGLGEIVSHLYVVKLRNDSNYDVMAFSSHVCLENPNARTSIFNLQKAETGGQTIDSVTVDGQIHPYSLHQGTLSLSLTVPSKATSCVAVFYANDLQLRLIDLSRSSVVDFFLRRASDFRDIYLAKSGAGLAFIRFYNEHELKPVEVIGCLLLLLLLLIVVGLRLRVLVRNRMQSKKIRARQLAG
jgi:hypothetical protein